MYAPLVKMRVHEEKPNVETCHRQHSHKLGKAEARRRIEEGFGNMRAQMTGGVTGFMLSFYERWEDDRLYFEGGTFGHAIHGHLDVFEESVKVEVVLPNILATIADTIMGRVKKEGQLLLEKK